jgi:hypothetical protein
MPLLIGLIVAIVVALGVVLWTVIPHTPPQDAVTATEREKQAEARMTPEQRAAEQERQRQEDMKNMTATERERLEGK